MWGGPQLQVLQLRELPQGRTFFPHLHLAEVQIQQAGVANQGLGRRRLGQLSVPWVLEE